MKNMRILFFVALSVAPPWVSAQVYKCIEERTGKVTYSQTRCHGNTSGRQINVRENSLDTSGIREQAALMYERTQREEAEREAAALRHEAERRASAAQARRDDFCKDAAKPIPGARGMTASQRSALAACAGVSVPDQIPDGGVASSPPAPMPVSPSTPSVITNCDTSGCWDNMGGRYNKGAGNIYFPASGGGVCQMIGGQMRCP